MSGSDPLPEPETPRPLGRSVARTLIDMFENSDEPKFVQTAAGKAPAHLSYNNDGSEEIDSPDDSDVFDEDFTNRRKRDVAMLISDEGEQEPSVPDLDDYFSHFDLDETQQIAICRTYANYLAQKVRSRWGNVKKLKAKK